MKKQVELELDIYDFWGRDAYLQKCIVCHKEYCVICNYSGIFSLKVCRKCSMENKKVVEILEKHLINWRKYNSKIEQQIKITLCPKKK